QKSGARGVRQPLIEDFFKQGVAPADRVADHIKICSEIQLIRSITLNQLNTLLFQLSAHGWIHRLIAAGDFQAILLGQYRQASHKGATNSEYMNMHVCWIRLYGQKCIRKL